MRTKRWWALVVLCAVMAGCKTPMRWPFNPSNGAAAEPPASASQGEAASKGLSALQALVAARNSPALGFDSAEEAKRAQLGTALEVYVIGLDTLKKYTPGSKLDTLLSDSHRALYPLSVDEKVASGLYVTQRSDGYRATVFGDAAVAKAASAVRTAEGDMLIYVPAAKVYFVGHQSDSGMMLIPIFSDPRLNFQAGHPLTADAAIAALQHAMAGYNGLPQ